MRFLMMLKASQDSESGAPPKREVMAEMGRLMEDMAKAGVLLAAEGLQPSAKGKRVRFSGGKVTAVRDGPFIESKELVGGFCMIDVKSWDEALEWTRRFAKVEGEGETELRPLYEASDFPPEIFSPDDAAREQALRDELRRKAATR
jgi:hypothetical protein